MIYKVYMYCDFLKHNTIYMVHKQRKQHVFYEIFELDRSQRQ